MDIRVLRYFLTVAREESFSHAAEKLFLSQPTLSRQIKDMEEELGVALFIRTNRNVILTKEGLRLRKRAQEIVELMDKTQEEFMNLEEEISGDVYIGGGETHLMREIAKIALSLQEEHPDIRYHLHSGNAEDVGDRLSSGLIDFGVFVGHADLERYESLPMPAHDVWGVFMRRDDPLAERRSITAEDLVDRPLIFSRQANREMQDWFRQDIESLDVVATYNLLYNASLLARRGIGYVVSLQGIVDISEGSDLAFRPLEPALTADVHIAWKRYREFSPAASVFLDKIRELWS